MNVIHRGSYPAGAMEGTYDQLAVEKFGYDYVNINMKKVLNNWITDRLNDFEKRQEESLTNIEVWSRMNENNQTQIGDASSMAGGLNS